MDWSIDSQIILDSEGIGKCLSLTVAYVVFGALGLAMERLV